MLSIWERFVNPSLDHTGIQNITGVAHRHYVLHSFLERMPVSLLILTNALKSVKLGTCCFSSPNCRLIWTTQHIIPVDKQRWLRWWRVLVLHLLCEQCTIQTISDTFMTPLSFNSCECASSTCSNALVLLLVRPLSVIIGLNVLCECAPLSTHSVVSHFTLLRTTVTRCHTCHPLNHTQTRCQIYVNFLRTFRQLSTLGMEFLFL